MGRRVGHRRCRIVNGIKNKNLKNSLVATHHEPKGRFFWFVFLQCKPKEPSLWFAFGLWERCWGEIKKASFAKEAFGDPGGARTLDPLIKSQLLYQLSYGVMMFIRFRIASAKLRQFLKPAKKICVFFKKSAFFVVFLGFSAPRPPIFVIFGSKIR